LIRKKDPFAVQVRTQSPTQTTLLFTDVERSMRQVEQAAELVLAGRNVGVRESGLLKR